MDEMVNSLKCACGCGDELPDMKWGYVKKFIVGHNMKAIREKLRQTHLGENNPQWKGDKVGLYQLHDWIRVRLVKSKKCQKCLKPKELDLANKSGKYLRDLADWEWLCRKCHMLSDGRMNNLKQFHKK